MAHRRSVMVATVAALAIGALTTATPATGAPAAASPRVPVLDWRDCGFGFECATAIVPLDYDRPDGATIHLALKRRPADDQGNRIGSLFINPGGPGGSGVDFVGAAEQLFAPAILDRFDVIGFDPRGVARSTPISCFESEEDFHRFLTQPFFPVGRDQEASYIRTYGRMDALCGANAPNVLANMTTADVARDLDLLRQAVGDDQLTYAGYSYGTMLGQTYVNLFPDKVRAVIIDGVLNPIEWSGLGDAGRIPLTNRVHSANGAYATLQGFLTECQDAGPTRCAFAQGGDPHAKWDILLNRLLQEGVAVTPRSPDIGSRIEYSDLVGITLGTLYSPYGWPDFAAALQLLWEANDPDALATALEKVTSRFEIPADNEFVTFSAVSCLDTNNPSNPYVWPAAAAQADREAPYFGRAWSWAGVACAEWPVSDLDDRYTGPWDAQTSDTVLVVGTRFDPATRYESAQFVSELLPNARLLTLEGYGHTSLAQSACIDAYVADYLVNTTLPPEGATCQTDVVPFPGQSQAAPQTRSAPPMLVPALVRSAASRFSG